LSNKLLLVFILAVLSFVCIAGCTSSNSTSNATPTATPSSTGPTVTAAPTRNIADPLIGTWTSTLGSRTLTWTFYNDGSARYDNGTIEFLPPNSWNRLDDTHYTVAGNVLTSDLTFDSTHTSFNFTVLPSVTFRKA